MSKFVCMQLLPYDSLLKYTHVWVHMCGRVFAYACSRGGACTQELGLSWRAFLLHHVVECASVFFGTTPSVVGTNAHNDYNIRDALTFVAATMLHYKLP